MDRKAKTSKFKRVGASLLLAWLIIAPSGAAADKTQLRVLIDAGQYQEVIGAVNDAADLEAKLLIVEALNMRILLAQSDNPKRDAKQAMKITQQVMTANPKLTDASIHYAISLGFYGRTVSLLTAFRKNIPIQIKDAIAAAEAANPGNGHVYALRGAWHFSVVQKAGAGRAHKSYGASVKSGVSDFEQALTYAPNDLMTLVNYIYMLHAAEIEGFQSRKDALIKRALAVTPATAADRTMQAHLRTFISPEIKPKDAMKHAKKFLEW